MSSISVKCVEIDVQPVVKMIKIKIIEINEMGNKADFFIIITP